LTLNIAERKGRCWVREGVELTRRWRIIAGQKCRKVRKRSAIVFRFGRHKSVLVRP
jgi:hypothetical protein